jgi:PD-(D/E)XK endonuclease
VERRAGRRARGRRGLIVRPSDAQRTLYAVLTTDQKGAIAETATVHAAVKLGIGVYKPISEGGRYDLSFDIGSRLLRVQCKWATRCGDVIAVRSTHRPVPEMAI